MFVDVTTPSRTSAEQISKPQRASRFRHSVTPSARLNRTHPSHQRMLQVHYL